MMKNRKKKIKYYLFLLLIAIPCFELAARLLGVTPFHQVIYSVDSNPSGAFVGDDELGIKLNPGTYQITLNNELSFDAVHNARGERVINLNEKLDTLPEILLLGCSFTYGYGVDYDQTFAAIIQEAFPNYKVVNKGVPGYGTVQSYLQLKAYLSKNKKPAAILLNFSTLHLDRNVLNNKYRKALYYGYAQSNSEINLNQSQAKFPYLRTENIKDIAYDSWGEIYNVLPLTQYSAAVNWIQCKIDERETAVNAMHITGFLFDQMNTLSQENNVPFGIVNLDQNENLKEFFKSESIVIPYLKAEFDFNDNRYTNAPIDDHPNEKGHYYLANKMIPFLHQLLAND